MGCLVRHGVYWRKPRDREKVYPIPIQRWLCKVCRKTISALPDFVMRFRWYVVEAIHGVVAGREEEGATWKLALAGSLRMSALSWRIK